MLLDELKDDNATMISTDGYNLLQQVSISDTPARAPQAMKRNINYTLDSGSSSDEPDAKSPRRKQKLVFPLKGLSSDRLAARARALTKQREREAAETLLELGDSDHSID